MSAVEEQPVQKVGAFRSGLAVLLVGAVLVVVGLLQTTTATVQPSCPSDTVLVAKFNYDHGAYVFEKPAGNAGVVTITGGTATGGAWNSTEPIRAIVVKGGPGSVTSMLTPPQTSGTFTNMGLPPVGGGKNTPDISNIQFCGPRSTTTTTTPTTSSSTTSSSTTSSSTTSSSTTSSSTTSSSTTSSSTTSSSSTSSSTSSTSTTTERPTTTTASTTSVPGTTTASTTTVPGTTTASTTTVPSVEVATTIVADDNVRVLPDGTTEALASTGNPSIPLVVLGIVLMAIGGTLVVVSRLRRRRATT